MLLACSAPSWISRTQKRLNIFNDGKNIFNDDGQAFSMIRTNIFNDIFNDGCNVAKHVSRINEGYTNRYDRLIESTFTCV